jgi:formylglycine-generating enzyme required for sulfatase activity
MRNIITALLIAAGLAACATQPGPGARRAGQEFQECVDCPVMVVVPSGRFAMGFDGGEPERYEGPVREVTIKRSFAAGRTEVTVAQFRRFVAATGHQAARGCYAWDGKVATLNKDANWEDPGFGRPPGPDEPAVCVDWRDAAAYAKWLAALTGKPYRLLSEAEWEYAADAGSTARFPWGEDPVEGCKHANIFDRSGAAATTAAIPPVACDDGYAGVAPVGRFAANAFGLYDMVGNVWEWTQDCYRMPNPPEPADGSALEVPNCDRRSVKGGSWITEAERQRPTFRGRDPEDRVSQVFGFRVARDLVR